MSEGQPEPYHQQTYAGVGTAAVGYPPAQGAYDQYPSQQQQYAEYPAGEYQNYPAPIGQVPYAPEEAPFVGLQDGMMVRVKVGFVRSLEDELGQSTLSFLERWNAYQLTKIKPSCQANNSTFIQHMMTAGPSVKIKLKTEPWYL